MHLAPSHAVLDLPTLHAFIKQHPLGLITTSLPSEDYPTLQSSHIPWVLDSETSAPPENDEIKSPPSLGVLRGHIYSKNPQGAAMVEASKTYQTPCTPGAFPTDDTTFPEDNSHILPGEVLIVFTSPVNHYISANFYTEKKPSGRVAPTWNYAAVQVYGRARIYPPQDGQTETFLRQQLGDLAKLSEEGILGFKDSEASSGLGSGAEMSGADQGNAGGSAPPAWKVADAPPNYIAALLTKIVGMRIEITRIEGRFKVSQERGPRDRSGVVEGLEGMGSPMAKNMAECVKMGGLGLS